MEAAALSIGGIFAILMLISGIVLTVITINRMVSGKIDLPGWGKVLLSVAMIAMLVIQIFAMLPPDIIQIDTPFVEEHYHPVTPSTPESIEAAP